MARRQLLSLFLLVVLGALVSHFLHSSRPLGRRIADSAMIAAIAEGDRSPETVDGKGDLTVVVFTDYQCSACRKASPELNRAIVSDGNIRVVYKDWPILGENSERAAMVALAADRQEIYPEVHHQLMKSPVSDDASLRAVVERAGGDWQQVEADLSAQAPAIAEQLKANRMDAFTLGLKGTPGYLIGSFVIEGALSEREFVRAFHQARLEL